ncbi:hypothetical protein GCM10025792_36180 [Pseudonocardia tropica]
MPGLGVVPVMTRSWFDADWGGALSYGGPDALLHAINQLEPQLGAATTR